MRSDVAISVKNLTKTYRIFGHPGDRIKQALTFGQKKFHKEFTALKDVSFEIKRGETVGIIGRNGSGKSTLLQLICGILKPTSGSVEVNGRISALLELGAGFNPEFTGRENVYFQGALMGLNAARMDDRFADIASFADIGEYIDLPVHTYSSGMYLRLAFAVNAYVDSDVLVIDEALAVGDAFFVQKCMNFLQTFIKNQGTVVFVSHDIGAVLHLCQTVYWLNDGKIIKSGMPNDVIESYIEGFYENQQRHKPIEKKMKAIEFTRLDDFNQQPVKPAYFINKNSSRNVIEIGATPTNNKEFGKLGVQIAIVNFIDKDGAKLNVVEGGSKVTLLIRGHASDAIRRPIIGFFVKNQLGQILFGENTYSKYLDNPPEIIMSSKFEATFNFIMPTLPLGSYIVTAAIADGSVADHIQHHWIHDALAFKSITSNVSTGLVGISTYEIQLKNGA